MKVTRIILFLMAEIFVKCDHNILRKSVSESKDNFFGNINNAINALMVNLFDSVNLASNFTKKINTNLLLRMHYDLTNIADKNFDLYREIQNITNFHATNQSQQMLKLDAVVAKVLYGMRLDPYSILKGKLYKHAIAKRKTETKMKKISEFGDSREFSEFIINFLEKVNNLTIKDFTKAPHKRKVAVPLRSNLKAWETPPSMELYSSNDNNTRRVFRGKETQVKKFPFIVSIHVMGDFVCAGSIISKDLIITAAVCLKVAYQNVFFEKNPKSIYVRLGSDYTQRNGETIPAEKLYFHPDYDPKFLRNNLAIIKLEKRIRFSRQQTRIRRIIWDKIPGNLTTDTKDILILGWGAIKSDDTVKSHQKLAGDMLHIKNFNECRDAYSEDFVHEGNFCAGSTKRSEGACKGDIGGPGIVGAVLMGVISFTSHECGSVNSSTIFTKLGYYVPWIEGIMSPQDYEKQAKENKLNARRKSHSKVFHTHNTEKKEFRSLDEDYPEEVKILKDILYELVQDDQNLIDDSFYQELYEDFKNIIWSTDKATVKKFRQRFLNKGIQTVPKKSPHSKKKKTTTVLTTSRETTNNSVLTVPYPTSKIIPFIKGTLISPTAKTRHIHKYHILRGAASGSELETYSSANNIEYTDNYEESTEDEYGLSVEVPITRTTPVNHIMEYEDYINDNQSSESKEIKNKESKPYRIEILLTTPANAYLELEDNVSNDKQNSESNEIKNKDKSSQTKESSDEKLIPVKHVKREKHKLNYLRHSKIDKIKNKKESSESINSSEDKQDSQESLTKSDKLRSNDSPDYEINKKEAEDQSSYSEEVKTDEKKKESDEASTSDSRKLKTTKVFPFVGTRIDIYDKLFPLLYRDAKKTLKQEKRDI